MLFKYILNNIKPPDCQVSFFDKPTRGYLYSCYDITKLLVVLVKSHDLEAAKLYHNSKFDTYRDYVLLHEICHHLTRHEYKKISDIEYMAEKMTRQIACQNKWIHIIDIQNEVIDNTLKMYRDRDSVDDYYYKYSMAKRMIHG